MKHPLALELNTRWWLRELSEAAGYPVRLDNIGDAEIQRWRDWGLTHIWLMGVWNSGPRAAAVCRGNAALKQTARLLFPNGSDDVIGASPYAVAGYEVAPEFGGEAGLRCFRRQLRRAGLGLLLDFIPNHVGLDHPWVSGHPEHFVQAPEARPGFFLAHTASGQVWLAHGRDPNFPPWEDTVQLDYRREATRRAVLAELHQVAQHCDGVRCDLAMLPLADVFRRTWPTEAPPEPEAEGEFWELAIPSVRETVGREFLFIAEVYWGLEERLHSLGFDYTYDKVWYDRLMARDLGAVQRHLFEHPRGYLERSLHFLENHDEARVPSRLAPAEHRAAALATLALPGFRLLHQGQLTGACLQTPVPFHRRPAEPTQPEIETFYLNLLGILAGSAVGRGEGRVLEPHPAWDGNATCAHFVVVSWAGEDGGFDLAVVNLANVRSQCRVALGMPQLAGRAWTMRDLLGTETYERWGEELLGGLFLDVRPHGAQLFRFEPQPTRPRSRVTQTLPRRAKGAG